MSGDLSPELRQQLVKGALLDGACLIGGVIGYVATGNWVWLVGGALLGAGFILPALIAVMKARR